MGSENDFNKTNLSAPSSISDKTLYLTTNGDSWMMNNDNTMDLLLVKLKNLMLVEKWIEFMGFKDENPERFLEQFI